jgi:hypothetical protein
MSDEVVPRPPARGRRRLFQPGQSGNPAGRRLGSRNKATLAAATLLDGEALGLTRRAVEAALAGDMLAMKLCLERVLPRCQERPVTFSLPSLAAAGNGEIDEPSSQNVSRAMNAVTTALACGEITPGEAATIAGVYQTFVQRPAPPRRRSPRQSAADLDGRRRCRRRERGHRQCRSHRRWRPVDGAGRRRPARQFVEGSYSTWRKNPPVDFLQMQEAESRRAIRG